MAKVLLIEDEQINQSLVKAALNKHTVTIASTLAEARTLLSSDSYEMILLDVNLPDGSGFTFFTEIQPSVVSHGATLIFLTGQADVSDKVLGYELGADDYITKPFDLIEFRARVESRLSKRAPAPAAGSANKIGHFAFNTGTNEVKYENGDVSKLLDLTYFDFKVLFYLAKNKQRVVSHDDLILQVWAGSAGATKASVDAQIAHLSKKIKITDMMIQTSAAGFQFVPVLTQKTA